MSDGFPEGRNKRQKIEDLSKNVIEVSNIQPNVSYEDSGIKLTTIETLPASENIDCVSLSSILSSVWDILRFLSHFNIIMTFLIYSLIGEFDRNGPI
jgi:hypothetical protein